MSQPDISSIEDRPHSEALPAIDQVRGITISDILRALRKNTWLILFCALVGLIASGIYVSFKKPVYEANSSIRIDPSRVASLGLLDILGQAASDEQQTEMAIVRSDTVVLSALNGLSPENFRKFAGFDKSQMSFNADGQSMTPAQEQVLIGFRSALHIKQVEGTQLVALSFRSGDRELCADILNHLMDAYLRHDFDSRYTSVAQVRDWLDSQMGMLRTRSEDAQRKLAAFQEANHILGTDARDNNLVDNLKLLSDRLAEAEGQRMLKEAAMRAADASDPAVLATLAPNSTLSALEEQEAALSGQYVQLASKYGTGYPPLNEVKQQLDNVKKEVAENVKVVSGRLHVEYSAARQTEQMLRDEYQQATDNAYALNRKQTDYAVLLSDVTSSRSLYNTLQKSLQQATVDAGLNSVDVMIVDHARAPIAPIEPKKMLLLSVGLILGLVTGVGSTLLKETLSDEIQGIADIESRMGAISLAVIPHYKVFEPSLRADKPVSSQRLVTVDEPRSRASEAYRALRSAILLSSIDRPVRTILVTSALPGEGKSSTSSNYAIVLAQSGRRILLIDADLRLPKLHIRFGVPNVNGLSARILDDRSDGDMLVPVPELPNLYLLPAGQPTPFPSEALGSAKFRTLLTKWSQQYDTVIIDSAPLLTVSDTLPLSSWVDKVILVARAGQTPFRALTRAWLTLRRAKASVAGVVLNDVTTLDAQYGDYGYYSKGTEGYYE